ncbi:sigma-70 family RNA polymerase sigma factor [Paraclostridium bifermentans]|uniref:sigma-70 family RNA polymerase sigma factor n=1 Tax=Paraclostridium bifermentans TaxID=1490 RepID=UPI00359C3018
MLNILKIPLQKIRKNSEQDLAKAAIRGDSDAFSELIKIHKASLYKIAYSYVKDEQKALDILQETVYKGLINIEKLKEAKYFKTWITKILINTSIDYSKKEEKIVYIEETILSEDHKNISIEDKLDLYDAIDMLSDNYKMVIILKYFNDMTDEQIAKNMDIPINTVKSHLRRAKEKIKQILKDGDL